jgi:hypothetical protein
MKRWIQLGYDKCTLVLKTTWYLMETLAWSRKIVRRARPVFYLLDGLMASCAIAATFWIV